MTYLKHVRERALFFRTSLAEFDRDLIIFTPSRDSKKKIGQFGNISLVFLSDSCKYNVDQQFIADVSCFRVEFNVFRIPTYADKRHGIRKFVEYFCI